MPINLIEKTRLELLKKGKKIINLSSGLLENKNYFFPQSVIKKGFAKYLKKPLYHPNSKGLVRARQAITHFYKKRDLVADPENILLTSGTSESYFELFKLLAKPGEEILFPNPAYPLFEHIANLSEIKIAFYALDPKNGWQVDIDDLQSKITPKTKAIVLISPNNPTGSVLSVASLQKIITIVRTHHLAIISDEVFSELIFDQKTFPRVATLAPDLNVFTLNGISKTYALPGLKLSWMIATGPYAPAMIEELECITDTFLACNQISQEILPDIINAGETCIKKYRHYLENNRDLTVKLFSQNKNITFHHPEAGPYLFAHIENLKMNDEKFVVEVMKATGIFVHPGYFYDYEEGVNILLSFTMETKKLERCLRRILRFIEKL